MLIAKEKLRNEGQAAEEMKQIGQATGRKTGT